MPAARTRRPLPSLRFRRIRALALLVALITVPSVTVHAVKSNLADAAPVASASVAPAPPDPAIEAAAALQQTIDTQNGDPARHLALVVSDLDTGQTAAYGAQDFRFATASIVKVDILATLLLQNSGQLTDRQRSLASAMIRSSSNGAATTLWRQIGQAKGLAVANAQLGLTATVGGKGGRWGETTTTAADQLQLLRTVFTDQSPLDADSRTYIQSLMGGVVADQDWGVSAADSRDGSKYQVKNGWLPWLQGRGWAINSIGSVEHQGRRLLVVALAGGQPTKETGIEAVEQVARDAAVVLTGV